MPITLLNHRSSNTYKLISIISLIRELPFIGKKRFEYGYINNYYIAILDYNN